MVKRQFGQSGLGQSGPVGQRHVAWQQAGDIGLVGGNPQRAQDRIQQASLRTGQQAVGIVRLGMANQHHQLRACRTARRNPSLDMAIVERWFGQPPGSEFAEVTRPAFAVSTQPGERRGRALYFTRATAPSGAGELLHHVGIYAYRRAALERFVALPPSPLERREKLEQLRALEAGMTIAVARIDGVPLGVDTPEDLAKARAALSTDTP